MKNWIISIIYGLTLLIGCKESQKKTSPGVPSSVVSQAINEEPELKIIPIEHATIVLEWGEITIYIDPVGGSKAFEGQKEADLILITDIHGDHLSVATLEELNTQKAKIIVPKAVAEKMPAVFTPQIDVLYNGETKERYGILVEAVPMYNLREDALNFHTKGRGNGYILNLGKQRVYISGDTEDIPEMRSLQHIDKAFICMNLPYTMPVDKAAEAVLEFQPKEVYPFHYRGRPEVSDVQKFKSLINAKNKDIKVVQLDWYPNDSY